MMLHLFHKESSGIAVPKHTIRICPQRLHAEAQKRGECRGRREWV